VLRVDACKTGWVGIALSKEALGAYAAAEISDLVEHAGSDGPLSVIAIDIPIGLPNTGRRQADLLVRNAVGPRWASVFITPVRPALETDDYPSAVALSLRLTDKGISRQAFGLRANIRQVDRWMGRPGTVSWKSIPNSASPTSLASPWLTPSRPGPELPSGNSS
jgi:predicted RNase H-like nuclease